MGEGRGDLGDGVQRSGDPVRTVHEADEAGAPLDLKELRDALIYGSSAEVRNAAMYLVFPDLRNTENYIPTYSEYVQTGDLRNGPWQQAVKFVANAQRRRAALNAFWSLFHAEKYGGYTKPETDEERWKDDGRQSLLTELSILFGKHCEGVQ